MSPTTAMALSICECSLLGHSSGPSKEEGSLNYLFWVLLAFSFAGFLILLSLPCIQSFFSPHFLPWKLMRPHLKNTDDTPLFCIGDGIYGSTFYLATGFHGFHVFIGTCFLVVCLVRLHLNHFTSQHHFGFEAAAFY